MTIISAVSTGVAILITVLLMLAAAGIIVLLYFRTKKERIKFIESRLMKLSCTEKQFQAIIEKRLANFSQKTSFDIFALEISEAESLKETYGKLQYENAVEILITRLNKIFSQSAKMTKLNDSKILIYINQGLQYKEMVDYANFILMETIKPVILAGALKIELPINVAIVACPEGGKTYDELMSNLDLALVVSKRNGINNFVIHNRELSNRESEEYKNYLEIKQAIDNEDFTLYYQEIRNITNNTVFGYEALLRWEHKTLGVLSPEKFLKIMEHSGDINWVGIWAFDKMLSQACEWSKKTDKRIVMGFNLSPKQLTNPKLCDDLRRALRKFNFPITDICMEIIEFAMWDKLDIVRENIAKLSEMGFMIAIDNYGLDASSLALLEKLKLDIIKLDREFINQSMESGMALSLLDLLVKYAKESNTIIIAEGIENEEMIELAKAHGVELCQGYLFSKPKSPKEILIH